MSLDSGASMCLEADQTVLAGLLEDFVEYLQQFSVGLGSVGIGFQQTQHLGDACLEHGRGIGDDQRTQRRPPRMMNSLG